MAAQRTFSYAVSECDVDDKSALQRFRDKRLVWESWLDGDPDHAIWANISQLVWREVAFGTLAYIADSQQTSSLQNTLITEAVLYGHVALQAMTIRRLVDRTKATISIPRLLVDIRKTRTAREQSPRIFPHFHGGIHVLFWFEALGKGECP